MFLLFPFVTLDNFTPLPRRQWTGSWELSVATVRGGFSTGKAEEKEIRMILGISKHSPSLIPPSCVFLATKE